MQLFLFFSLLREVVVVVEGLYSLMASENVEPPGVCALCVNSAFAVPSCSFVTPLPAGKSLARTLHTFEGQPPRALGVTCRRLVSDSSVGHPSGIAAGADRPTPRKSPKSPSRTSLSLASVRRLLSEEGVDAHGGGPGRAGTRPPLPLL